MVKTLRFWIYTIIVIIILVISSFLYIVLNGTPWAKATAIKEMEHYIATKFTKKIVMGTVQYAYDSGYYFTNCHVQNNPALKFEVDYVNGETSDDYNINSWKLDISKKIGGKVKNIFNGKASLNLDVSPSVSDTGDQYKNYRDKVPNYFTIQKSLGKYSQVVVEVSYPYQSSEAEKKRIFTLVRFLQSELPFEELDIWYKNNNYMINDTDIEKIKTYRDFEFYWKGIKPI